MTAHPWLPGLLADPLIGDSDESWPVSGSEVKHQNGYLSLRVDTIVDPQGGEHPRSVVQPHGAIGVVAIDEHDRILLVEQYRHPVARRLLEIPAGTLDVPDESTQAAAARELAEEADLVAEDWESILRLLATPGYSTEHWEVFVATGLSAVPADQRTVREAEEADMAQWWLPFGQAVDAVLAGRITDSMTVAAILAVQAQRAR
ncbi:NUDIX domain-containing protein [Aeromicrobium fastidiosum]|uniref:NUDIX hydrolase n=1 Tax=Aeromicrobium fastidiosum TaxID=52699 RepID=A0A641AJK5_9ACTN|nr:NUDIX hydrolase [Aeromicrobium fastidiosum]KAA1372518.1 NUDIX hydrolase [Aeromicrobium fastidiosum]MBP2391396.1 ADP-ribose pyrophosphatase [Aeromicrobium fastidiosum]